MGICSSGSFITPCYVNIDGTKLTEGRKMLATKDTWLGKPEGGWVGSSNDFREK
jgi:hypothetical protein